MAILTDMVKEAIVTQIAQFQGYSDVARMISAEFDVTVDRFQVRTYDPTSAAYAGGERWREIFDAARKSYLTAVEAVPIANKGYRLNELQRLYERAVRSGNLVLASSLLEQGAKEAGGALTNERHVRLEADRNELAGTTPEERRRLVTDMLRNALSQPPTTRATADEPRAKAA